MNPDTVAKKQLKALRKVNKETGKSFEELVDELFKYSDNGNLVPKIDDASNLSNSPNREFEKI